MWKLANPKVRIDPVYQQLFVMELEISFASSNLQSLLISTAVVKIHMTNKTSAAHV